MSKAEIGDLVILPTLEIGMLISNTEVICAGGKIHNYTPYNMPIFMEYTGVLALMEEAILNATK